MNTHPRSKGIALVLVLWVVALLSIMAAALVATSRGDLQLTHNRLAEAQLRSGTEAAITQFMLRVHSPVEEDHWYPDGSPHSWWFNNQEWSIRIDNEAARIDLNSATAPVLEGLLAAVGAKPAEAARLAKAIVDWRDPGNTMQLQGAEKGDYRAAGLPYGPKNAPFSTTAELGQVLGFSPALVRLLEDAITVDAERPMVDLEYASSLVLTALSKNDPSVLNFMKPLIPSLGGPVYRIRVRAALGGPTLETLVQNNGIIPKRLWRRLTWDSAGNN